MDGRSPAAPPPAATDPFEALAQSAPDGIVVIDEDSIILSANSAMTRIFGYLPEELIGQSLTMLVPERMRAAHESGVRRYLSTGRRHIPWTGVQLPALARDGREIPVEISFGEFLDRDGRRVFSGFLRDVSERARQEEALRAARETAEEALRQLTRLGRITDVALARTTYDEMLEELLRRLREELSVDDAMVLLVDDARAELRVVARDGRHKVAGLDGRVAMNSGIAGRVAFTGQRVVAEDISELSLVATVLHESIVSVASIPVWSEGQVIGVVQVGSAHRRVFSHNEVALLEVVADRMAGVFARTRLYAIERQARAQAEAARRELQQRERELQEANHELHDRAAQERELRTLAQDISAATGVREVMSRIAQGARRLTSATAAYVEHVTVADRDVHVVAADGDGAPPEGHRVDYPGSLTSELIARRAPAVFGEASTTDTPSARYLNATCPGCSLLVVPLLSHDTVLGALVLLYPGSAAPDDTAINRAQTLGDLAALSLQRLIALEESERRRAEAERAVRSRDDMLSVVSHDLRNPVNTIVMSASLLRDPDIALPDDQRRRQLEIISRSAYRMDRLIQDLLDVARMEGGRLTLSRRCEPPGPLATEVVEAFRQIAAEKSIELACEAAGVLRPVLVDRDRVVQALSNYVSNAIKFTPAGGRVAIHVRATAAGVRYEVADTGPGIGAADLPNVFQRFWQAKDTAALGTGLGLSIVKGIADAHGGEVGVTSQAGAGATFFMDMPAGGCS